MSISLLGSASNKLKKLKQSILIQSVSPPYDLYLKAKQAKIESQNILAKLMQLGARVYLRKLALQIHDASRISDSHLHLWKRMALCRTPQSL